MEEVRCVNYVSFVFCTLIKFRLKFCVLSWIVVVAVNGDGEGVIGSQSTSVGDLVIDIDDLRITNSECVVGGI